MGHIKKHLSAQGLHESVRRVFDRQEYRELKSGSYSWTDCLMSGLAIFGLKCPSLLKFEGLVNGRSSGVRRNLENLYGVKVVPSDKQLRERLDQLSPEHIRKPFNKILAHAQRGKLLERYRVLDGYYPISADGTGQYSSKSVFCNQCCCKEHRNGEKTYYHQLYAGAIVHPDEKVVIPVAPEPITRQDGNNKNDCERNAAKRFFTQLRKEHPHLKWLALEDGLSSNYPHLSLLDTLNIAYLVGVKPGDHDYLFDWVKHSQGDVFSQADRQGSLHHFKIVEDVPLNDTHGHYRVTVIIYREEKPNGKVQNFSWITRLTVNQENAIEVMRVARSRWKIENETFNTLKNQGYEFEHNYGHGYQNLCSVFSMLMLLAFTIDQIQQGACQLYQKAREQLGGALYSLHETMRSFFSIFIFETWTQFFEVILSPWQGSLAPP